MLKHRHPGNLAFHGVSGCVFYGLPIAAVATGNPWWLCGLPLSSLIGLLGHYLFEQSKIDLQDAVFSFRTMRCLNRMFWRILTGHYPKDIQEMTVRLQAYQQRPEAYRGFSLYHQQWTDTNIHIPLVIVHGGGDHSGRHVETAKRLVQAGYAVHAFDLPGHGRSPGKRGHIRCFEEYIASVRIFVERVSNQHSGQKPILLGHSLGGLIGTRYAIKYHNTIRCLVLSSPLWGLKFHVPLWKRTIAHCLLPVWPSFTMGRPKVGEDVLSHDPQVTLLYTSDPLVHSRTSVRLYAELLQQFKELPSVLPQLKVPTLILQAGADRVASPKKTAQLFPSIGSTQMKLIIYDGYYHEVLHEVDKERVFQDLLLWLQAVTVEERSTILSSNSTFSGPFS